MPPHILAKLGALQGSVSTLRQPSSRSSICRGERAAMGGSTLGLGSAMGGLHTGAGILCWVRPCACCSPLSHAYQVQSPGVRGDRVSPECRGLICHRAGACMHPMPPVAASCVAASPSTMSCTRLKPHRICVAALAPKPSACVLTFQAAHP